MTIPSRLEETILAALDKKTAADPPMTVADNLCEADRDTLAIAGNGRAVDPTHDDHSSATSRDSPSDSAVLDGVTVPGYDLLQELGRGGMGVVYKARHRRLNRLVSLKMILGGAHVGQSGLARFRTEAEAVAKLDHPNIVHIYETGDHDGCPYLTLEFVEGGSLNSQMRENPATPQAAAELAETLARAMDFAHQHGIVHRDQPAAGSGRHQLSLCVEQLWVCHRRSDEQRDPGPGRHRRSI